MNHLSLGSHTWDISLYYYRCPYCGYIVEGHRYKEYRGERYIKTLHCLRCRQSFRFEKTRTPTFAPLL